MAKLSRFGALSRTEIGVLETLCSDEEHFRAGVDLLNEGDPPRAAFVLTRGLACRYRGLADGRRQILTFLLPGDFFELQDVPLQIGRPFRCHIDAYSDRGDRRNRVNTITAQYPRIGAAFWWCSMQEAALMRERIVMLGRRNARARVAYILCELVWRHREWG